MHCRVHEIAKCHKKRKYDMTIKGILISCPTNRPDSPTTFPGTCKGNFLCLQMISFEFLRVDPIG